MKRFFSFITSALLLLAAACEDDPNYVNNPVPKPQPNEGFLTLNSLGVKVISESETTPQNNDTGNGEKTRAAEQYLDTSVYRVKVISAQGDVRYDDRYSAMQALTEPLTLPVGKYHLLVSSEEPSSVPAVDWEHPLYGADKEFTIRKGQTETLGEVVCKLKNIKVTVVCSADLAAQLSADTKATVSLKEARTDFSLKETRAAYFQSQEVTNTLVFNLKGKFTTGEDASLSKEIKGVAGGQWRKITIVNTFAEQGNVKLDIKVDSFILDEEIIVDGTENVEEPSVDEGSGNNDDKDVKIEWAGHDFAQQYVVESGMTIDIDSTVPAGIASYEVHIISKELAPFLSDIGLPDTFDLCNVEGDPTDGNTLAGKIHNLGFPINAEVKGKTQLTISITNFVELLLNIPGEHNFALTVTDNNGKHNTKTIQLKVN